MKKLLIALALLACSSSLFAQSIDGYGIPQHSMTVQVSDATIPTAVAGVGVGVGYALGAGLVAIFSGGKATVDAPQFKGWIPFVSAEYEYHFPDTRWSVGPGLGYWHQGLLSKDGDFQMFHFTTVTADGKFWYKPAGICKLYGGLNLGAGIIFSTKSHKGTSDTNPDDAATGTGSTDSGSSGPSDASVIPAFQFNPIGMRLGSEKVAFVAELGVGYKGFINLGVNFAL